MGRKETDRLLLRSARKIPGLVTESYRNILSGVEDMEISISGCTWVIARYLRALKSRAHFVAET